MNNYTKVTVPKNVAAAIAHYVNLADTKTEALTDILSLGYEAERSEIILRHFDGNHDELMHALICGYQVEKSPEEKVREYFEGLVETFRDVDNDSQTQELALYESTGIVKTLELLGITVEGVNA
jgi:DNA integrity scanning protein DisA with diadenylate cyclase activity